MLLDVDMSQLEFRGAAFLSQDPTMIKEISEGLDIHSDNALKFFGSLDYRTIAKVLVFRAIYGGSAYAFYMDSRMPSFSLKRWEEIVEAFYEKYKMLGKWQNENYKLVCKQGWYRSPTGRKYAFKKYKTKDGWQYSKPEVCNYAVQGICTGDIVPLLLVILNKRLRKLDLTKDDYKIIMQVHDSIVFDLRSEVLDIVASTALDTMTKLPEYIEQYWGFKFNVPLAGEAKWGYNWMEMEKWKGV